MKTKPLRFPRNRIPLVVFVVLLRGMPCTECLGVEMGHDVVAPIVAAATPETLARARKVLLKNATIDQLQTLGQHRHAAVALYAEWARAIRAMRVKQAATLQKIDCCLAQRFLGFAEGRLRLRAPQWWQQTLLSGMFSSDRESIYYEVAGWLTAYRRTGVDPWSPRLELETKRGEIVRDLGWELTTSPDTKLRLEGTKVIATVDGQEVAVPVDTFREASPDKLDFLLDGRRCYLAVHHGGSKSWLLCIDLVSGALLWRTEVWGIPRGCVMGLLCDRLSLVAGEDRVVVFGAEARALFIEAFEKDTGRNEFRFSTWHEDEGN